MDLHHYLNGLYSLIKSRQEIDAEHLFVDETVPRREGVIEGRLRFWDGSLLEFVEILVVRGFIVVKTDYTYHYQDSENRLIFRYDNAPHHPEVATFPHHKHILEGSNQHEMIMDTGPPHLHDVLREIDLHLYPDS